MFSGNRQTPAGDRQLSIVSVQYATSTGNSGYETAESFIFNSGKTTVKFVRAELDGETIWDESSGNADDAARRFRFDIGGVNVAAPASAVNPDILWRQFQPSPVFKAGEAGVFQICFKGAIAREKSFELKLESESGETFTATIPRHTRPARTIQALALSADGSQVTIRYSPGPAPVRFFSNGIPVGFHIFESAEKNRPGVMVATLPRKLKTGENMLSCLYFDDGSVRRTFQRALPGISIEAPSPDEWKDLPENITRKYGFDTKQRILRTSYDVVCDDTRAKQPGSLATAVIKERIDFTAKNPEQLYGVDFCTALFPEAWNIYAPIADAVIIKPYQLNWGTDPDRFIELEDARIATDIAAAMPRPVLWVPERFGSAADERISRLHGEETEVLSWVALMRGARGIRHHWWKNPGADKFAGREDIAETLPKLNADIDKIRPILDTMVAMGASPDRANNTVVYEAWNPDGILLMVRNMNYALSDGQIRTTPRTVTISHPLPLWLSAHSATDPLTGESIPFTATENSAQITIPDLAAFKLIRITNK